MVSCHVDIQSGEVQERMEVIFAKTIAKVQDAPFASQG
jgi:hypothetical protein